MTIQEIQDKHFAEYLIWCADPQTNKPGELLFWVDYKYPSHDNFMEWIVKLKKDELNVSQIPPIQER